MGIMGANFCKIFWKAARFHFTPCSTLPAILGSIIAAQSPTFSVLNFCLLMIAITANHLAVNMTDDYFDFLHGADVHHGAELNAYAGGSGVLVSKEMAPTFMRNCFITLYLIAACIGLYFVVTNGWLILALGIIGVFSSYFYTAPPIRFSYRGFGELAMLINLGPVITIGAFYIQNSSILFNVIAASLPLGLLVFAQIIFNEIPDYETDKKAGKGTLVVRFGKEFGMYLALSAIVACFSIVLISVFNELMPISSLIIFFIVPLLYKAFSSLKRTLLQKKIEGNFEMVKAHVYAGILLIVGYAIHLFQINENIFHISIVLLGLAVVMLPVIIKFYEPCKLK